jgi:hypothetical protein
MKALTNKESVALMEILYKELDALLGIGGDKSGVS